MAHCLYWSLSNHKCQQVCPYYNWLAFPIWHVTKETTVTNLTKIILDPLVFWISLILTKGLTLLPYCPDLGIGTGYQTLITNRTLPNCHFNQNLPLVAKSSSSIYLLTSPQPRWQALSIPVNIVNDVEASQDWLYCNFKHVLLLPQHPNKQAVSTLPR